MENGVVEYHDPRYPTRLKGVKPRVERLYYKGSWGKQKEQVGIFDNCVAIVGSRKMTNYGKQVLSHVVPQLVNQGYTAVSGFMYGVDIEVHRLTYLSGGRTIAVLGWGIDYEIDIENRDLYYKLIDSDSLFVSEYAEDFAPSKITFPQRNRIVAGLAKEVIVIEGAKNSGSLITAHLALKQGKKLWAVPGQINSNVSKGTNSLIKEGLAEMLTLDDIKDYSKLAPINRENHTLSYSESKIVELIETRGGASLNEVVRNMDMGVGEVARVMMELEMKGVVKEEGGKYRAVSKSIGNSV